MKTLFSGRSDMPFAMLLLAPSLILLGGLVAWPMISNIEISFLRLPLNPRIDAVFVGLDNYIRILGDAAFWHSLWGMFTFRLPPMTSPRSLDGDRKAVSASLRWLDEVAARTGTTVYLEPLNRYQDHMINTLADARRYIEENGLKHVQIIGDFYHMNIEEDSLTEALHHNRDLLGHVHIADNHRYQPGSGSLDFASLFDQLRADNYQGYVVYECRVRADDPAQAYKDSLTYLREC